MIIPSNHNQNIIPTVQTSNSIGTTITINDDDLANEIDEVTAKNSSTPYTSVFGATAAPNIEIKMPSDFANLNKSDIFANGIYATGDTSGQNIYVLDGNSKIEENVTSPIITETNIAKKGTNQTDYTQLTRGNFLNNKH